MSNRSRIIIQCRLSSNRLPLKALLPIANYPLIVLCALRAMNKGADTLIATSSDPSDDILTGILDKYSLKYVRGPLDDVLARFAAAVEDLSNEDIVIRYTADNLFPDGALAEEIAAALLEKKVKYIGTSSPEDNLPYGLSAEAFTVGVLREANQKAGNKFDREHVTPWIKQKYGGTLFRPQGARSLGNMNHLSCTIDTFDDYCRMEELFRDIISPVTVSWQSLCRKLLASGGQAKYRVPYKMIRNMPFSNFTLGTVQLGMDYGITNKQGMPSTEEAVKIIQEAIRHGVTNIDCARAYGRAESIVGKATDNKHYRNVNIITKLDPIPYNSQGGCLEHMVDASIFRSCRELRMNRLPVVLLHRWFHRYMGKEAIWNRLRELQEEGVIGELGVSVATPAEALEALNEPGIKHLQLPFNILDWRWKDTGVDQMLLNSDIIVYARSTLLQGILTADADLWPLKKSVNAKEWLKKIDRLVLELGRKNRKDLCFAYVRAQKWITSLVIGVESIGQLRENMKLFLRQPLNQEECAYVQETLAGAPEQLLNPAEWS